GRELLQRLLPHLRAVHQKYKEKAAAYAQKRDQWPIWYLAYFIGYMPAEEWGWRGESVEECIRDVERAIADDHTRVSGDDVKTADEGDGLDDDPIPQIPKGDGELGETLDASRGDLALQRAQAGGAASMPAAAEAVNRAELKKLVRAARNDDSMVRNIAF